MTVINAPVEANEPQTVTPQARHRGEPGLQPGVLPRPDHATVYQLSGVYSSGLTPLILTALIGAAGGSPWLACGYLVATAIISIIATLALEPTPLQQL